MLQFWLFFFFFNDTATTEIYTLSLHDALPISRVFPNAWTLYSSLPLKIPAQGGALPVYVADGVGINFLSLPDIGADRKSTRLNSSHGYISYAVFCLKKKNTSRVRCRVRVPTAT